MKNKQWERKEGNERSAINPNWQFLSLFISHVIRTKGRERMWNQFMAICSNGSTRQIRAGRSCHSYVINCPVELGRDSN